MSDVGSSVAESRTQEARDAAGLNKFLGLLQALAEVDPDAAMKQLEDAPDWLRRGLVEAFDRHLFVADLGLWDALHHDLMLLIRPPELKPTSYLGKGADADKRARWLTRQVSLHVGDCVAKLYCGEMTRDEALLEAYRAAEGLARVEGWPESIGTAAADGAWAWAEERFGKFNNALRGRIWALAKVRTPEEMIVRTALEINEKFGWVLPHELLLDIAADAAKMASRRRVRRGR